MIYAFNNEYEMGNISSGIDLHLLLYAEQLFCRIMQWYDRSCSEILLKKYVEFFQYFNLHLTQFALNFVNSKFNHLFHKKTFSFRLYVQQFILIR